MLEACSLVCATLQIRQPVSLYSDNLAEAGEVFDAIFQAAEKPEKALAIPMTPSLKVHHHPRVVLVVV